MFRANNNRSSKNKRLWSKSFSKFQEFINWFWFATDDWTSRSFVEVFQTLMDKKNCLSCFYNHRISIKKWRLFFISYCGKPKYKIMKILLDAVKITKNIGVITIKILSFPNSNIIPERNLNTTGSLVRSDFVVLGSRLNF